MGKNNLTAGVSKPNSGPQTMRKIFDILEYGAVADVGTDSAAAIQKAIDDCSASGGGIVRIPENLTFMAGPFDLKSFVELRLERGSRVIANPDESVYTKSAFKANLGEGSIWIGGENAKEVTISGEGTIDGNGIAFMGPEEKPAYALKEFQVFDRRPHVLTLVNVTDLAIHQVTFKNAAYWCIHLVGCNEVSIQNIRIDNSLKIRNSDGIDLDHTRNVIISNCFIESGDDCICFKTRREYEEYGPTENVMVSDCVMTSTSCAVKLGSENMDAIRYVEIKNCVIRSSNRGIGIQNRDEGAVEHIRFSNLTVEGRLFDDVWWGKAEPIYVTAYKRKASTGKDANIRFAPGQTVGKVGPVRDISFSNITCRSENGLFIGGEAGMVSDITLDSVDVVVEKITRHSGGIYDLRPSDTIGLLAAGTFGIFVREAAGVKIRNCSVRWGKEKAPYFDAALRAVGVKGLVVAQFSGEAAFGHIEPMKLEDCSKTSID
jgi:polygalacturonase